MRSLLKIFWPGFLLTLCVLTFGVQLGAYLPDPLPVGFDADGQPTAFTSPAVAIFLLPTLTIGALALFTLLWRLYGKRGLRTGTGLGLSISALLNGVQLGVLETAIHPSRTGLRYFIMGSLAFFCASSVASWIFGPRLETRPTE